MADDGHGFPLPVAVPRQLLSCLELTPKRIFPMHLWQQRLQILRAPFTIHMDIIFRFHLVLKPPYLQVKNRQP